MKEIPKTFFAKSLEEYNAMQGINENATIKKDEIIKRFEALELRITTLENKAKEKTNERIRNNN